MIKPEYCGLEKAARAMAQETIDRHKQQQQTKKENNSAGVPGACTSSINHQCALSKDHQGLHRVKITCGNTPYMSLMGTQLFWSSREQ